MPEFPERALAAQRCHLADTGRRVVARQKAEEYRRLASECLAASRAVSSEETRAALIAIAQGWLRLAEEQDDEDPEGLPLAREQSQRPAAQQQQQVQPKKEENND